MRVAKEVARADDLDGEVERFVVDQDRAQHRPLGLEVVRQRTLRRGDGFGHGRKDGILARTIGMTNDE